MKILLQNRYDALTKKGGDTYQMLMLKKYLEQLGVKVDISTALSPELSSYDLVHLFNLTRVGETYVQYRHAKAKGRKIVLSPVYQSRADVTVYENNQLAGSAGWLVRNITDIDKRQLLKTGYYTFAQPLLWPVWFSQWRRGYTRQQREILENVDQILPNSEIEMDRIKSELFPDGEAPSAYTIVPNGVEIAPAVDSRRLRDWLEKRDITDFIICAGRIEPLKSQLAVMAALKDTGLKVVFVGAINPVHRGYAKRVLRQCQESPNFFYLGEVAQNELMYLNKQARLCIQASWFETTGLAGLEAGLAGANVVMTERGYTREYFGASVWYCDPASIPSIREAVIAAYAAPRDAGQLSQRITNMKFTWPETAKKTWSVYQRILGRN
ncbi:MAG: glycosyltransferase family 4 protein [bacterium]|nr:glycosyltransferase family 4 protein [bacterium]